MFQKASVRHDACLLCKGTEFTWGDVLDSCGGRTKFGPEDVDWKLALADEVENLQARRCGGCGNVPYFVRRR